jgi:DNA-cytosine methyltransferase
MNVLSLFDGISACKLALTRAGHTVDNYYTAEIDKYAEKISMAHYPDAIRVGDVTRWKDWDIDWASIDLVTGGFPCQAWSVAGKQLGDKDERGMLFWTMLDIMKTVLAHNPKAFFLMENVKMKKEFEQYITHHTEQALGHVNKHLINSALVSAQNRQRYYWTNIQGIEQPQDKGILLKDIIDSNSFACKYNRKDGLMNEIEKAVCISASDWRGLNRNQNQTAIVDREKSYCIDANCHKGGNPEQYFDKSRRQLVFERPCKPRWFNVDSICHHVADAIDIKGNESIKRIYAETGKSPTLSTCQGGHREPKVLQGELTYRKLTPLECERLQTFPDGWTDCVSNTQRYKALGNAWTVDVVAHIFKNLVK